MNINSHEGFCPVGYMVYCFSAANSGKIVLTGNSAKHNDKHVCNKPTALNESLLSFKHCLIFSRPSRDHYPVNMWGAMHIISLLALLLMTMLLSKSNADQCTDSNGESESGKGWNLINKLSNHM